MSSEYTTLVQGLETYRLADLRPYHANPRRGDVAQIARSLSRTGQYRPIVVNAGGTPQRNGVPHSLEP